MYRFLATCPKGLGSLLKPELELLGADAVTETVAGVAFEAPMAVAYRSCLHSRLANRILLVLSEFAANTGDELYQGVKRLPWTDHLRVGSTLAIDFSGRSDDIRNTQFGAQRAKDAIVDVFRERGLARPNVDVKQPDLRLSIRLHRGKVTVSIDLSGGSLHQRGYRTDPGKAPLKENLAAAVLMRAGWPAAAEQGWPLIDPMCGSGTLLIEAALMAKKSPPGLQRRRWGFDGWLGHDPAQWQAIRAAGEGSIIELPEGLEIRGYDGDIRAVRRAEALVAELGLQRWVRVRPKALRELTRPSHRAMPEGLLVCNPPWGERLGNTDSVSHLYRHLGETLHREFQGWKAGILTSNLELGRKIGLRSHRQYGFNNGAIDVTLLLFELDSDNRLAPKQPVADISPNIDSGDTQRPADAAPQALSSGAQMVANRLRKNRRRLNNWLKRDQVQCYRLYDADMPEYAVAIDLYDGVPHVAEYAPPKQVDEAAATRRFEEVLSAVRAELRMPADAAIATKRRQRQRGQSQYRRQDYRHEKLEVQEGAARILVNLHDYLDTGLFLDHRPLRLRIGKEAKGKHFLNLFCYTGVASIHAALGGAVTSTSVDLSNTYLGWYRENLALNGLSERQHRAERADCLAWLERCERKFDLILLDPPSFSNSKSTEASFDVARDHEPLVRAAMAVLAPEGTLYFSNNRRGFKLEDALKEAFEVENITAGTIPPDFERRPDCHLCWKIQHRR